MDEPTDFQIEFRMRMLERMALRAMIESAAHGRSLSEARRDSVNWLESNLGLADKIAHGTRDDRMLAQLYEVEAREVIDYLIGETEAITKGLEAGREQQARPKS